MKKYLSFMAFAMVAVFSLTFISCGDDDDELTPGNDKIEINGKQYTLSPITSEGSWDYDGTGEFCVAVMNGADVDYYQFYFTSDAMPKVGDDFSKLNISLQPQVSDPEIGFDMHSYSSGTAKVVAINTIEDEMTIKFDKLKMANGSKSYIFNGTATLLFNF